MPLKLDILKEAPLEMIRCMLVYLVKAEDLAAHKGLNTFAPGFFVKYVESV